MYVIILGRSEKDRKIFGTKGAIFLGKQYVKMGRTTSLSNEIYLDVATSHVVFVVGKRGSGKCLHGDTLVTLEDGNQIAIKNLKNNEHQLFALNHDLKVARTEKQGFYERTVDHLLKIRLRSGKEIKLTPEHPLLKLDGWAQADTLKIGDRIATPRKIDSFGTDCMPESEVKVLAYLIAEGHLGKKIFFSNIDDVLVEDFTKALSDFDKNLVMRKQKQRVGQYDIISKHKRKVLDYNIVKGNHGRFIKGSWIKHKKTSIRTFLEDHGLYKVLSRNRFLPKRVMQLTKNRLSLFLNRLFSCDGSIHCNKCNDKFIWQVSYSSSSEILIRQVQNLLLRFGILSKLRYKKVRCNNKIFDTFELVMSSENVRKFIQEIGFFSVKELKQEKALKELKKPNPNVDTIPKQIWDFYRPKNWAEVGKTFGYTTPKALRSSINYSPSRQKLLQIALVDNNERVKKIAESDIFWDDVASVEHLRGKFKVYDITVPELHNFVANDIIVHNSYTMSVIAEGVSDLPPEIKQNIAVVMLDTMGIYWTMKYPNKKDKKLLDEWNIQPKALDIHIFTPTGYYKEFKDKGIPTDAPFAVKPSDLDAFDWCKIFEVNITDPIGVLIEKTINHLMGKDYGLDDIIASLKQDDQDPHVIHATQNRFENAKMWGLFDKKGTPLTDLVKAGRVTVLDVSCYVTTPGATGIRALVIALVAKKLFLQRMVARRTEEYKEVYGSVHYFEQDSQKKEMPLVWLIIDECHEFLPKEGKTIASDPLITILREGRQPGISLILASQQPGKIHTDVMTQADITIAHTITAKIDTDALGNLTQTYMRDSLDKQLSILPRAKGSCVILDDMNERIYPAKVRPKFSWHGGGAPSALKEEKKLFNA